MSEQRLSISEIREAIKDYPGDALATVDHAEDFLAHLSKKVACQHGHTYTILLGTRGDVHEPSKLACDRCGREWNVTVRS